MNPYCVLIADWSKKGWVCRFGSQPLWKRLYSFNNCPSYYVRAEEGRTLSREACYSFGLYEEGPSELSELYFVLNCSWSLGLRLVSTICEGWDSSIGMQQYYVKPFNTYKIVFMYFIPRYCITHSSFMFNTSVYFKYFQVKCEISLSNKESNMSGLLKVFEVDRHWHFKAKQFKSIIVCSFEIYVQNNICGISALNFRHNL